MPILRYAEVLINRAEALNELSGPNQESIDLLNEVRRRSNAPDYNLADFATKESLRDQILKLEEKGQKTLLLGVSFALLDLIGHYSFDLEHTLVMETGGMKGRRKEIPKTS